MTRKQKLFCDEYLIDLNATRAYLAVYKNCKSEETASSCSYKLLRNAEVKAHIEERLKEIQSAKIATAQEVLEYLTSVLRGESESEIVVVEGGGDGYSSARHIAKLPDERERLKAADQLGRYHTLFTDRVDASGGDITLNINVDYGEEKEHPKEKEHRKIGY